MTAKEFIAILEQHRPCFIQSGDLNIPDWEQVKGDLKNSYKEKEPDNFPNYHLFPLASSEGCVSEQQCQNKRTNGMEE